MITYYDATGKHTGEPRDIDHIHDHTDWPTKGKNTRHAHTTGDGSDAAWHTHVAPLDECPDCPVTGPDVYRAAAHPLSCVWMMRSARRCDVHDELLTPGEATCPTPDVDEEADDPHGRRTPVTT